MTEPVLFRRSFLIALMTALHAVIPAAVALGSLYVITKLIGNLFDTSSTAFVVVGVLCLVLVQAPREVSTQLMSSRLPAAASVIMRWFMLLGVLLAIGYVTKSIDTFPRRVYLTWAVVTPAILVMIALAMQEIMRRFLLKASDNRAVIFAGYNDSSMALARRLSTNPTLCLKVCGFFDDRSEDRLGMASDAKLLGKLTEVAEYVKNHHIDVIFISLPIRHVKRVMDLLDDLRDTTASIYYVPDIFVFDLIQARSAEIEGVPVVAMCETPFYGYRGVTKRLIDIVISGTALLLLAPVFLATAVLVKISSPGPIIFRQRRYGLDGEEIIVYKFRSMKVTEDGAHIQQASKQDPRITRLGSFLRRSSLDELPQLINVLQGRMSLVGPRPHAVAHNEQYRKLIKGYMMRHKVLPGITGLAQVNGCRGETTRLEEMQARVNYDLDYLRHWTPMLDFKILFMTAMKIFKDDKAY
jgi:putative colanic acid biosynthesis UDP-glucose lipid carrier transferase